MRAAGNSYTDWKAVMKMFNSSASCKKTVTQGKNYVHLCKGKYTAWKVLHKMIGIAFNDDGLPAAEELRLERMQKFISEHSHGLYVSKNTLLDLELWEQYFGGKHAICSNCFSPALAKQQLIEKRRKRKVNVDFEEGSGDSDDPIFDEVGRGDGNSYALCSISPTPLAKRRSLESVKLEDLNISDVIKITDAEHHTNRVYTLLIEMDEVKQRGDEFVGKAITYIVEKNLDRYFSRCDNDAQKWSLIKILDEN